MIRQSLDSRSKNAFIALTPENGISLQVRNKTGGSTKGTGDIESIRAPYWIKLVRKGDVFTGYMSKDGKTWTQIADSETIEMPKDAYIGFTVCGKKKLCKAVFSNYRVSGTPANFLLARN